MKPTTPISTTPVSFPDPLDASDVLTASKLNKTIDEIRRIEAEHRRKVSQGIRRLIPLVHPITGHIVDAVWVDDEE